MGSFLSQTCQSGSSVPDIFISLVVRNRHIRSKGHRYIRGSTTMPEEQPLEGFVTLQFIGKSKDVVLVGKFQKIEELGARFHNAEWW